MADDSKKQGENKKGKKKLNLRIDKQSLKKIKGGAMIHDAAATDVQDGDLGKGALIHDADNTPSR